jgi:ABC-2 type transport system ATP-binding protein
MEDYIIETKKLTKIFFSKKSIGQIFCNKNKAVLAVDQVDIRVKKNEIFALVGPNGAGKSTLIKMLSCLILPTLGSASVNGFDIIRDEMRVKNSIGLITGEERSFYFRLTGRENLSFFSSLYNIPRGAGKDKIKELRDILEIENLDMRFQEYSTGMKQRFAIARSLLNNPEILFMDEPTKNLDPITAVNLRRFVKNELVGQQRKTVVFCTHNLLEAVELGDRIAIMNKGKISALGSLNELRNNTGLPQDASIEELFRYHVSKSNS